MTKRELFKALCFGDIKWSELKDSQDYDHLRLKFNVTKKCRKCGEPLDRDNFVIGAGYWGGIWSPSHKECTDWVEKEHRACKEIDADCNDCLNFVRGEKVSDGIFSGTCKRFGKEVFAYPNFCSGHDCLEAR